MFALYGSHYVLINKWKLMGVRYHKKLEERWYTEHNGRAIVFIQLHITYVYCVLHFVPLVSIVMAALHEKNVSLIEGPSRLAGLSCYLLTLTGLAWFYILSWYICLVVSLPSSVKRNKLNNQTCCREEGSPWFPISWIAKLRGHYGWFYGEIMLIWEENKLG